MFEWNDPRLAHRHAASLQESTLIVDGPESLQRIWLPDIFVVNAKRVSPDAKKHISINDNGDVKYMLR